MPRVKRAVIRRKRLTKLFKASKGFFGGRKNLLRTAICAVQKSRQYQYRDRRTRKRDFRRLWVVVGRLLVDFGSLLVDSEEPLVVLWSTLIVF
jgi:ribosomal protein L20